VAHREHGRAGERPHRLPSMVSVYPKDAPLWFLLILTQATIVLIVAVDNPLYYRSQPGAFINTAGNPLANSRYFYSHRDGEKLISKYFNVLPTVACGRSQKS
jgi:hypothetical protein